MKNRWRKPDQKRLFYFLLISALIVFAVSIPLTQYESLRLYLWKQGSSFYDFFTCLKGNIYYERSHLYADGTIYPPLANLFYAVITRCMSAGTLQKLNELSDYNEIKALQECSIYFVVYMNITLLAYYTVCTAWKKGSRLEKNVFAIAMLFTVPFLYQFERANLIFVCLILCMFFFAWKDSSCKALREFAYFSLAVSAGMKIYPAIFGVILLKEKKYKEALRLALYGFLLFFLPFFFYGNPWETLLLFIRNLISTSDTFSATRIGCQLDYATVLKHVFAWTGGNRVFWAGVMRVIVIVCSGWALFGLRQQWKLVLLMTCLLIGIPSISYVYTAVFMIIPLILYLDSDGKSGRDIIYLLGMLFVMIPLPFCWTEGAGDVNYSYMNVSTPVWVEGLSILLMTVFLLLEGISRWFRKKTTVLCSALAFVLICGAAVKVCIKDYNAPYAYTNYLTKTLSSRIKLKSGEKLSQTFTAQGTRLDYIVMRAGQAEEGTLTIRIEDNTGMSVLERQVDLSQLTDAYDLITFEQCELIPGSRYVINIIPKLPEDMTVSIWRTIDYLDTGDEIFSKDGERLDGAMGIQIFETG